MSNQYNSILNLFIKPKHKSPMTEVTELVLKEGYGIEGDANANPISPRQILIVRYEDILELSIPPGELRENIVIKGIKNKDFLPGSILLFESGAAIRLTFHCEPCKRIAHLVNSLKSLEDKRGILGVILRAGKIKVGDSFKIEANKFPALPAKPYLRFLDFIAQVPKGQVVTYKQILHSIGVDGSYMRAIPTYLKKTSAADYPIHRILDTEGHLIRYVDRQKQKLESEGVEVLSQTDSVDNSSQYFVALKEYGWSETNIYLN